jgi:alanyl-tRNA synthetase
MVMQANLEAKKPTPTPVLSTQDIREKFVSYFQKADYKEIDAVPVVSPSGIVITSALTPVRDILLGKKQAPADNIVSIQLCIRAGSGYNDHETVVSSDQHLTSFDSASFFSFENSSNKKTINVVYNFLIKELKINPALLFITVHKDDRSALTAWKKLIPKERIFLLGDQDNVWQEQGISPAVSGYSTEIFYDQRPQTKRKTLPSPDDFRNGTMTELVNIVSHKPAMNTPKTMLPAQDPLPFYPQFSGKSMGVPRMAAIVQAVPSVYETDEIRPIMQQVEKSTGKIYAQADKKTKANMRVICDHMRTVPILIHNGVKALDTTPAGNTLKDLLQRAQTATKAIAPKKKNVLTQVAQVAIKQLASSTHPQIEQSKTKILNVIGNETTRKK